MRSLRPCPWRWPPTLAVPAAHADSVYDEKFLDYRVAKQFCPDTSRQGVSTWKAGYHLMKEQGRTETQTTNFI